MIQKKGLTLIELVLAVFIMAAGLVVIMRFAPSMMQMRSTIEQTTKSVFLAIQKIEETRGIILHENDFSKNYTEGETSFPAPYEKYGYTILDNLNLKLKTITVKVYLVDKQDKKITMDTQIAKRVT